MCLCGSECATDVEVPAEPCSVQERLQHKLQVVVDCPAWLLALNWLPLHEQQVLFLLSALSSPKFVSSLTDLFKDEKYPGVSVWSHCSLAPPPLPTSLFSAPGTLTPVLAAHMSQDAPPPGLRLSPPLPLMALKCPVNVCFCFSFPFLSY